MTIIARLEKQIRPATTDEGSSLIEVTIAAAILAFIAIGFLTLFLRAAHGNVSGSDSSEASQHARAQLEELMTLAVDDRVFSMQDPLPGNTVQPATSGADGDEMLFADVYWDDGARAAVPAHTYRRCNLIEGGTPRTVDGHSECIKLGDGGWTATSANAKGLVVWQRRSVVRQFTYADVSDGVLDQAGDQLVTLGHSQIFDRPLASGAASSIVHFTEETVELKNRRGGEGAAEVEAARLGGTTMGLGPRGQRTAVLRAF